jgi:DNA-binding CsgD family transcriptional regulator/tetratricopeptide (TPR) repeat protein
MADLTFSEPRLVGRTRELAGIGAALQQVGSRSTMLWIHGEPGIGKTRLLDELCARAHARGDLVLAGRGAEFERDIPFGVWIDALDDHTGSLGHERLERMLGDRVGELAWVLPVVPARADAKPPFLPDERYLVHRAVRGLLDALARQRAVVVALDDLHWADDASHELLAHLLRRPSRAPVLLAVAFRTGQLPVGLSAALETATRGGRAVELAPVALSAEEADVLLGDALHPGVRREVFQQSGGNPFYLEQLARWTPARAATAAPTHSLSEVPGPVAVALAHEIAALGEPARRLAEGAAVAGEPVELDQAAAAADLDEPSALTALDELLAADLLRRTETPRRYRFRHPIVRRAVYQGTDESWRVAAALQARGARLTQRAHHLERCARPGDEAAIAVLEQAAHAVGVSAPASAARWLAAALRLLSAGQDGEARALELLVPLAVAQAATGQLEQALDTLQDALARVPSELAEVRSRLVAACAAVENLLGRHAAAHARLLQALGELRELSPAAAGVLHVELAADACLHCDFAAMLAWAQHARASALACEDPGLSAVAVALLCLAHYYLGEVEQAERCREEAAARLDALTDEQLAGRLVAPYCLGFAEMFCERYDDAAEHLRRGIEVARATSHGQFLVPTMIALGLALEPRGHVRESVEMADAAVDAARLAANPQVLSWALTAQAWTTAMAGEHDRTLAAGEEAVRLLDGLSASLLTRATHTLVGAAWLEAGHHERALHQLQLGGAPDFAHAGPGRRAQLYAHLARAELARGNAVAAKHWLDRGETTLSGLELPMAGSVVQYARACLLLADEQPAAAGALALQAAERATAVHALVQAARCRTLAGRALAAAGQRVRAAAELQRAEAELGACGAMRLRDEAARELRRLGHRVSARQRRAGGGNGLQALSGREHEIAMLVAQGHTNRQIGQELFLSARTVEGHLTNVFAKFGVRTRAEVAEAIGHARALPGGRRPA